VHGLSLAHRQDLRSGQFLYREGGDPTDFYLVVSGRLRATSDDALLGYIGRLEPVGSSRRARRRGSSSSASY
jgi:CRP-like cAMP-binding protein